MTKLIQIIIVVLFVGQITAAPATCRTGASIHFNLGECIIRSSVGSQNDVHSWGFNLNLVDAGELCMVPSTVTNATFITADGICTSEDQLQANGVRISQTQCLSRRGGLISTQSLKAGDVGKLGENPGWVSLGNVMDRAVEVSLQFFTQTVSITAGLIYKGQQSTASHFGLASDSGILRALKSAGIIGARSFGLNVGSQSVRFPRPGSLVLGGWDSNSVDSSSFIEFPIMAKDDRRYNRHCALQVEITDFTLNLKRINETSWTSSNSLAGPGDTPIACIEPYDNLFRIPATKLSPIRDFINRTIFGSTDGPVFLQPSDYAGQLVNLEPGLVYHNSGSEKFNTTLRLTVRAPGSPQSLTVEIPQHEFQRPLRGLDDAGVVKLEPNYTELQIFGDAAPGGGATVLGKVFLSQVYLYVDYEKGKFYMAPQNTQATSPFPVSSACAEPLSAAGKAAIAAGVIIAISLLLVAGTFLYKRYWSKNRAKPESVPVIQARMNNGQAVNTGPPEDGLELVDEMAAIDCASAVNGSMDRRNDGGSLRLVTSSTTLHRRETAGELPGSPETSYGQQGGTTRFSR